MAEYDELIAQLADSRGRTASVDGLTFEPPRNVHKTKFDVIPEPRDLTGVAGDGHVGRPDYVTVYDYAGGELARKYVMKSQAIPNKALNILEKSLRGVPMGQRREAIGLSAFEFSKLADLATKAEDPVASSFVAGVPTTVVEVKPEGAKKRMNMFGKKAAASTASEPDTSAVLEIQSEHDNDSTSVKVAYHQLLDGVLVIGNDITADNKALPSLVDCDYGICQQGTDLVWYGRLAANFVDRGRLYLVIALRVDG